MQGLLRKLWRARAGTAAIEFAIIVPVLLSLGAGILEFGLYYQVYDATNRLASQIAAVWSDCSDAPAGTCLTEASSYSASAVVTNLAPRLTAANVTLQLFQVRMSGTTPTVVYARPSGATMSAAQITAAQAMLESGDVGVVVTARYVHTLQFFSSIMSPALGNRLNISYTVVQLK